MEEFKISDDLEQWLLAQKVHSSHAKTAAPLLHTNGFNTPSTLEGISAQDLQPFLTVPVSNAISNALKQTQGQPGVDPIKAFQVLTGKNLSTREVAFLWQNEPGILKMAALGSLPKNAADGAHTRAKSRIRSATQAGLKISGYVVTKPLRSSQDKSCIWSASQGTRPLIAKVYISAAPSDFGREVSVHHVIGDHPHITKPVHIVDFEGKNNTHAGVIFFPRYLRSLSDILCEDGVLPDETVFQVGNELLAALQHIHEKGYVHCDVKPANVMLDHEGKCVLIDLASGVCKGDAILESTSHYALGLHRGCAQYALDLRCLAVTMFELLTGRIPSSLDVLMSELKDIGGVSSAFALECANAIDSHTINSAKISTEEKN